jgi:arginyl-tRNA synthetase
MEVNKYDASLLDSDVEIELIKLLTSWTKTVELAAVHFEPHRIAFYLQSLASAFHSLWNLGKENNDYRFVVQSDMDLTTARLALAKAVTCVMKSGFDILGIEALEKM